MYLKQILITSALIGITAVSVRAQDRYSPLAPPLTSALTRSAQQFRLGDLTITGNRHTKLYVILRMIPISPGEIFNTSLWELGLEQINRSGLFEPIEQKDVVLKPNPATGLIDVELHLTERDRQRVDFSGGSGTTGGSSISVDYANTNLSGRADRLTGRIRFGSRERAAGASYSVISYGKLPIYFDLSGFFERLEFVNARTVTQEKEPLFVQRSGGGSIGIFVPLNRSRFTISSPTRVGVVYAISSTNLADLLLATTTGVRSLEEGGLRTASLTLLFLHNTLDRELDPQRGESVTLGVELGGRALGGSLNSFRPYLDYRRFWSVTASNDSREPMAVGVRFRVSHVRSFGEPFTEQALSTVRGVPVFNRVFLGGETEVRGYDVNSIAPLARLQRFVVDQPNAEPFLSSEVRPVGGDTKLLFNAEYRVPVIWQLSTAAFFDIGASFNARRLTKESFETMTTVQSTGAPVTVLTVLKPLKPEQDFLPAYRASLGGELRFPIPLVHIPLRLIFAWNPNAQKVIPEGALVAPEKRFAFRIGFSRTL
ncbi:MAG TPA: BamA/TamA family outer membrane protein [Blastocatellia bacterium]|nr:BamA/TamA family outer membrane protein [Blastocatellia bacterium]